MEIRDALTTNKHTHIRAASKKDKSRPKLLFYYLVHTWSRKMAVGYKTCEKFSSERKSIEKKIIPEYSFAFR